MGFKITSKVYQVVLTDGYPLDDCSHGYFHSEKLAMKYIESMQDVDDLNYGFVFTIREHGIFKEVE